jgi:hypothetical protein
MVIYIFNGQATMPVKAAKLNPVGRRENSGRIGQGDYRHQRG